MADNIIKIKKNNTPGTIPTTADLQYGELAVNIADGVLFFKLSGTSGDYIESVNSEKYSPYTWNAILSGIVTSYGNNTVLQPFATILGGYSNINDGPGSTILNGQDNTVIGNFSLVGGGVSNYIGVNGDNSAIIGGINNVINHKNTFTLGSGLTSQSDNFTYTNNISSTGIVYSQNGNSDQWNSSYSTVQSNSASWNMTQNGEFLPLSGGVMSGKLIAAASDSTSKLNIGNAINVTEPSSLVNGDIWITSGNRIGWKSGGVTYASAITNLSNTFNQPQIINLTSSVSPALRITQNGSANAFVVEDSTHPDTTSFVIDNVGSVGIGLSSLSGIDAKLTVVGNISSTGIIYASGGNSELWNSVYSNVLANSGNWGQGSDGTFLPLSGGTMSGKLTLLTSTTASAPLNIGIGQNPTNPVNGDIWGSPNTLYYRHNGITRFVAMANQLNEFSRNQVIDVNDPFPALRITQRSAAHALVIEDSTNPDSTPFVVDNVGSVGIGLSSLSGIDAKLTVVGNISSTGVISASASNIRVNIINDSINRIFTDADSNRVVHIDTTTSPLCAIFPTSLSNGFNVAIMNTGTNNLILSAAQLNSVGTTIATRYGGVFVYKDFDTLFAVGRLV